MTPGPLSARSFFRDPLGHVRAQGGNGEVIRLRAGTGRYAVIRDPDAIWRVLVTESGSFRQGKWKRRARRFLGRTLNALDGEEHRQRRAMLDPSLDRRRIARLAPAIAARAERAHSGWQDGARLRLRDEIDPVVLTMAGDVLLSTDLEPASAELAAALTEVMRGVPRPIPPVLGTRQARALARVDRAVAAVIEDRRRSSAEGDDLVDALLRSDLPEETVRGELIAFLLAAVDEPPSALEAAWYLLGRTPEAEERLHAELDTVLGDRAPTLDDEVRLRYLNAVVRETLRLLPPARHIDRCPVEHVTVGDARFRAGSNVIVSPLVTHHEPTLYDRASQFVPERWLAGSERERARGTYLPFGAGVHACIGASLARTIITLTLASISRRWRLRVDDDAPAPVPAAPRLTVTLERR
ncbi:MAG: cytochrome P450 [Solirubrobacterales bacterium]